MAKVHADQIHELRESKGWSQEMLAKKAGIDPKTMSKLLNGGECRLSTIALIAEALGVEPGLLIVGNDPDPPDGAPPAVLQAARVKVQLKVNLDYDTFDELRHLEELLPRLKEIIGARHDINIIAIARGSVLVTLSMAAEDVKLLISAYLKEKLDPLQIESLNVLSSHFEMPDDLPRLVDEDAREEWDLFHIDMPTEFPKDTGTQHIRRRKRGDSHQ